LDEHARIESTGQRRESGLHPQLLCRGVLARQPLMERKRHYFGAWHDSEARAFASEEARRRERITSAYQIELLVTLDCSSLVNTRERRLQSRPIHRLEQVVHRLQLEGIHRILIERGAEDDRGSRPAERRGHFETAAAGHLNVQQHQIGHELGDSFDRLHTIFGFANDLDIVDAGQQLAEPIARRLLVVN
jgi:hypothetical protein